MKFSEQWLREWVNPKLTTSELAEQLTMAGLEVDSIEPVAAEFSNVMVGHVLKAEQHPDADRLKVCTVDVGESEPVQIVCGGANVRDDLKVPVAVIGAVLGENFKIKKAKLRGVESRGMICSESELGLAETSEGIMELPADAPVGQDIRDFLQLNDVIVDVDLTPNRADCLGMRGLAREVGALNTLSVEEQAIASTPVEIDATFPVKVSAPDRCPRYVGRVIRDIDASANTPLWMTERLRRGGIRAISPLVDVTNYVMLELGQPMHAFDLDELQGGIDVRLAKSGEKIKLLDGDEIELEAETLLIADENGPLAMAGGMGGEHSGVSDKTQHVFLESAFFSPAPLATSLRRYHLHTESSHRFERGVDPQLQMPAIERATELLLSITGGKPGPVIEIVTEDHLPRSSPIHLRPKRIAKILGETISDQKVEEILSSLGLMWTKQDDGWVVSVPSYRFDISLEVDLIEEVARLYGYNQLPTRRPNAAISPNVAAQATISLESMCSVLVDKGYAEVINYSFVDAKMAKLLDPDHSAIELSNPISADMSVMRTSLWPGLVKTFLYNRHRQQSRIRLFEAGVCFIENEAGELSQIPHLGGVVMGNNTAEQWGMAERKVDFFDVKHDICALFDLSGDQQSFEFQPGEHLALHPGKSAQIIRDGALIGHVGSLHPQISKALGVNLEIFLFELSIPLLSNGLISEFKPISKFPSVRRDIAIIVPQRVTAQAITSKITQIGGELLHYVQIFDIYEGKGIDLGKKSVAIALTFQASSHTLSDEEVNGVVDRVVDVLKSDFNGTLRD